MGGEYKGTLAKKLPAISVLGAGDAEALDAYRRAALERHGALFQEFKIEPPAPDDATSPAWRDLALALARRHVPAFMGKRGRPATERRGEDTRWFLASEYFRRRDAIAPREADRKVAEHFRVEPRTVVAALKEFRRPALHQPSQTLLELLDKIEGERGKDVVLEALAEALTPPDLGLSDWLAEEIDRLARFPY